MLVRRAICGGAGGRMAADFVRDAAATAAVFAFFASAWFGWAQERPPRTWRTPLAIAAIGSVLVAVLGGVLTWLNWSEGSVFDQDGTPERFGVVVGIEVAAAGIGAVLLSRSGKTELMPAWIALVVGVHFVPLGPLLEYPLVYVTAVAVIAVAVASVPVARSRQVASSAVTGAGTGVVLLVSAVCSLALMVG